MLWVLLLSSVPAEKTSALPPLYTVRLETVTFSVSLSFLCFGRAEPLLCEGQTLAKESGKVAPNTPLLWGYADECKECILQIKALQKKTQMPLSADELSALLLLYRQKDKQAQMRIESYLANLQTQAQAEQTKANIEALLQTLPAPLCTVSAKEEGWFTPLCDGYEAFDRKDPFTLTAEDINAFEKQKQTPAQGKLYTSPYWYAAAQTNAQTTALFSEQKTYLLPYGAGRTLSGKLVKKQADLLVFEIYGIPTNGILRTFDAEVVYDSQTGMRVPKTALQKEPETWVVRVYAGDAEWIRSVQIICDMGRYALVKSGSAYSSKRIYPLKENQSIYIEYPSS